MMSRRFVNLAMTDCKNHMFSMHRLDVAKHLFYPTTAEAEAACGRDRGRGRADKGKPAPKIRQLRLPPPIMGFEPSPTRDPDHPLPWGAAGTMFVLLHGPGGRSSEASRILFTTREGQAAMYDADSRSVISVPGFSKPKRYRNGTPKPIVTGAGAGEDQRLYVMHADGQLELLDLSGGDKSRAACWTSSSLRWQPLPPLPRVVKAAAYDSMWSSTVVDGGRIICVSWAGGSYGSRTSCFDTESQEWWQAGDWLLPFHGSAEYVPELDTWLGFSSGYPDYYLNAADLSGVAMAQPRQAPTLQHVWEDFKLPSSERTSWRVLNEEDYPGISLNRDVYWSIPQLCLVNLGSGRFCVAKVVHGEEIVSVTWSMESLEGPENTFTVLTGVEVIRGGDGELRMVKHKSRELVHPGLEVACVL